VAAPDTLPEDQRAAMSENPPSATRSEHSAKAKRHRGKHHPTPPVRLQVRDKGLPALIELR
jgi:hypothetical protein